MATATLQRSSIYAAEIRFLNRKLVLSNISWESRPALSQLMSPIMERQEADKLLADLKSVLGAGKVSYLFEKLAFVMPVKSQLRNQSGFRVVISVSMLRQLFGGEIDSGWSGGGKGYNPYTNRVNPGSIRI